MSIQIIIFVPYQQTDLNFIAYENECNLSNAHLVNIKVIIAPISLRSIFYCLLQMKINVIPKHKSRKMHGFDLDKATITCIKMIIKRLHM